MRGTTRPQCVRRDPSTKGASSPVHGVQGPTPSLTPTCVSLPRHLASGPTTGCHTTQTGLTSFFHCSRSNSPSNTHSDSTCPHVAYTPREQPSWAAIRGCSDSHPSNQQPGATGAVAKFTLVSTGTAAVFYSWVRQGRQRLPVATAAAYDAGAGCLDGESAPCTTAAAAGGGSGALFTMPDLQGVILPGESKTFRWGHGRSHGWEGALGQMAGGSDRGPCLLFDCGASQW